MAAPFGIAMLLVLMLAALWIPAVLVVRFGLGVFGATFYTAAVTASTDLAPGRQASAVATLSISIYLGFAAGPPLGELLLGASHAAAWLVPAALATAAGAVMVGFPETRPATSEPATPDPERPVVRDGDRRRETPQDVEMDVEVYEEVAPGVTGAGLDVTETRPTGTRLWLGLLHPAAVLPGITLLTLGVGYQAITSQSAVYAKSIGMATSAPLFNAFALSIFAVRLVSGRLADRIGPVRVMFPGIGAFVAGFTILALFPSPLTAVVGIALVGTGWAVVFPAVTAWLAGRVPDAERGSALGSLISFMDIGQGSGGYAVGAVADAEGFGPAFALPAAAAAGGGAVLVAAVRSGPRADS